MLGPGDPLWGAVGACAVLVAVCWLASVVTGNYSQVDRLWSILPAAYVGYFAACAGWADTRLNLMALLTGLWGVRLTYNFARKGGYRRGSEDYRWPELRRLLGPIGFQILNATFIAPYQNLLLLLIAIPAYVAWGARGTPLGALDVLAAGAFLVFLVGEIVADQQQWRFQCAKQERRARGEASGPGFVTSGLFRFSRHPNFFCEMAMWWTIYLFAVAATGRWLDWSMTGTILLTLLFQGSTWFTERMMLAKYPAYAAYRQTTSRFLPMIPTRRA